MVECMYNFQSNLRSHTGAAFGSCSGSHHPSSLPSKQSAWPSQNNWVFKHVPSAQAVSSSGQIGSLVLRRGFGVVSSAVTSQLLTTSLNKEKNTLDDVWIIW